MNNFWAQDNDVNANVFWWNTLIFLVYFHIYCLIQSVQFSSVQSLSRVWLFAIPWTTAPQASLCITTTQSSPKPMSIDSVILSNHLILCCPLLLLPSIFPSIRVFFQWVGFLLSGGQSIGVSTSASVLPMNTQDWLILTGCISMQSKRISRVFPNTTVLKHQFSDAQPSLWSNYHIHTWLLENPC